MYLLTHLAEAKAATQLWVHLTLRAQSYCTWYPDATAVCLTPDMFLLMYPSLDLLAAVTRSWVWSFFALRKALANSLRRAVSTGVHQGVDLGEGRESGV